MTIFPRGDRAVAQRELRVWNDKVRIKDHHRTEPVAFWACPVRAVKGKAGWCKRRIADITNQTGGLFAENERLSACDIDGDKAF